jgi:hypothetical protein
LRPEGIKLSKRGRIYGSNPVPVINALSPCK